MYVIHFKGWFQCRLATNPDPYDEPRGVSGSTFALIGEPDLDREIHLQPRQHLTRKPGPTPGVLVTKVEIHGAEDPKHPLSRLVGGTVELCPDPILGGSKYEGRNGALAIPGKEPIDPFDLKICAPDDSVQLRRKAMWDPTDESKTIFDASATARKCREPRDPKKCPIIVGKDLVMWEADLMKPTDSGSDARKAAKEKHWCDRITALGDMIPDNTSTEKLNLQRRIDAIQMIGSDIAKERKNIRDILLSHHLSYEYELNGKPQISSKDELSDTDTLKQSLWTTSFWMGAWDADVMCGFMKGHLCIE